MITPAQSKGFSLARGFIVFIMPAVHSVMLYSSEKVKLGWLGQVLGFLAEGPGAQLFMFLMGLFIVWGRPKTNGQIIARSLTIGLLGYTLNLFRLVIPYYLNLLPVDYVATLATDARLSVGWQLFLVGDILQFAAIAYFLCSFTFKYFPRIFPLIIITLMVWWVAPYTWGPDGEWWAASPLVNLLTGAPPQVFFPVFPWIFYPLLGLVYGQIWKQQPGILWWMNILFSASLFVITGQLLISIEPAAWTNNFYRQGRGGMLLHGGIVLFWIALFMAIARLKKPQWFFGLLDFCSKNITILYVVQWIIIMWTFRFWGYHQLNLKESIMSIFIVTVLSFCFTWCAKKTISGKV